MNGNYVIAEIEGNPELPLDAYVAPLTVCDSLAARGQILLPTGARSGNLYVDRALEHFIASLQMMTPAERIASLRTAVEQYSVAAAVFRIEMDNSSRIAAVGEDTGAYDHIVKTLRVWLADLRAAA